MGTKALRDRYVSMRMPTELHRRLRAEAIARTTIEQQVSVADVIRRAVEFYLNQIEEVTSADAKEV